jgi:hypothetical protein
MPEHFERRSDKESDRGMGRRSDERLATKPQPAHCASVVVEVEMHAERRMQVWRRDPYRGVCGTTGCGRETSADCRRDRGVDQLPVNRDHPGPDVGLCSCEVHRPSLIVWYELRARLQSFTIAFRRSDRRTRPSYRSATPRNRGPCVLDPFTPRGAGGGMVLGSCPAPGSLIVHVSCGC